jgi:hypothetical protein
MVFLLTALERFIINVINVMTLLKIIVPDIRKEHLVEYII